MWHHKHPITLTLMEYDISPDSALTVTASRLF
ncbi:hypothetical protein T01_11949 [Trichinella spiralis]|uniref:Uncharacterized protein n=1 Tax=Trichinella spiralis TaxID=6334 RepID=A0A0V0YL85_TRISP|nr:hypothetical protein T01_11949 [Trichinella spiralis]